MSSLAFDKQGKPFSFQRRTKKLLVRLFRNPSARGTCSQVMNAEGLPLYIDPETDYIEFRKAVGHVPGLYRLDQCDENSVELDDAQAAYVAIDVARNASASTADGSGASDVNPLVIIEHLVAIQADAMKTMAAQHAAVMAATAEILRAPYRPAPAAPAPAPRNAQPDDESDADEDFDDLEEQTPVVVESPWAPLIEKVMPMFQMIGGIGMVLLQQKFLPGTAIAMPGMSMPGVSMPGVPMPGMAVGAPAPVVPAAPTAYVPVNVAAAPVHVTTAPNVAAAPAYVPTTTSSTPAPVPTAVPPRMTAIDADDTLDETDEAIDNSAIGNAIDDAAMETTALVISAPVDTSGVSSSVTAAAAPAALPVAPMSLPQQYAHLLEIRARLLPDENAFAQAVIAHMDPAQRAQWIAALSAMSIDDATASIRTTIAQLHAGAQ
jgi:hypothetical protein